MRKITYALCAIFANARFPGDFHDNGSSSSSSRSSSLLKKGVIAALALGSQLGITSAAAAWVVKSCKKWGFDGTFFINPANFHHVAVKETFYVTQYGVYNVTYKIY